MRRGTVVLVLLAAAFAGGCGRGDELGGTWPSAAVARAECSTDGARVSTAAVRAQRDGLHVDMANTTGGEVHFTLERGSSGGAGATAPPGRSEHVFPVGPGAWVVTCYAEGGGTTDSARFELVDTGVWVSTEIADCETPESSHGDPPRKVADDRGELPELARRGLEDAVGLAAGDVVEPAGYPGQREAIFRARHDGRTIATVSFSPEEGGGWLEGETTTCSDLGGTGEGDG
jgi:hypothetical protein